MADENVIESLSSKQNEKDEENEVDCKISLKTNRFSVINVLSTCSSDYGVVEVSEHDLEDDDKLLVVDEDISDSDGELLIKNIAED